LLPPRLQVGGASRSRNHYIRRFLQEADIYTTAKLNPADCQSRIHVPVTSPLPCGRRVSQNPAPSEPESNNLAISWSRSLAPGLL